MPDPHVSVGKPQTTMWHSTGEHRTVDGGTQWKWLCPFCGQHVWKTWAAPLEDHRCPELERYFPAQ